MNAVDRGQPAAPSATVGVGLASDARAGWSRGLARRVGRLAARVLPPLALAGLLLAAWEAYANRVVGDAQLLPPPSAVWAALVDQRDDLWANALVTLGETAVGFAAALTAGAICGVLVAATPWLRRALYPLLVASQTVPIITLAPLLVLWFGFGLTSKAIVVTLICFFPIAVALADGLGTADPELIRLYRAFGAGPVRIFWSVRLPGAVPALFSGVRIAVAYSVAGAIFGEYVGAEAGLGFYIQLKQHIYATASIVAAIAVTAALSIGLFAAATLVEHIAIPWHHPDRRRDQG